MKIGVLALQGDFTEHLAMLRSIGVDALEVRLPSQLESLDGLIIPGGESTAIGKLAAAYGLIEPLREFGGVHPIWGTCAGAILLSDDVHRDQPLLSLMHIQVERNAFGRQVASFEIAIDIPVLKKVAPQGGPYPAIFIRAPLIEKVGEGVQILAQLEDGRIVAAQQGRLLATSFHPELTTDNRIHQYFVGLAQNT